MNRVLLSVAAAAACLFSASGLRADNLAVYVGYADNLRASPFFPVPWIGDPNVVTQSPANQTFDSGALRIDNTGTNAITITNLTVELDPTTSPTFFQIWAPLTIDPGQIGIFAQNNYIDTQFDTSDYGFLSDAQGNANVNGQFPYGGCTNPDSPAQAALCMSDAPVISFTENGTNLSFVDSGNILDTFGYDLNTLAGSDGNESIQWNAVGSVANRGGTPEPSTVVLLITGLAALGVGRKFRFKKG